MKKRLLVQIHVKENKSYPVFIADNLITHPERWLPNNNNIVIITDNTVKKHYGERLSIVLKQLNKNVLVMSFPAGEKYKTAKTKQQLENKMLSQHLTRDTLIIALGGGVVGDIAGFIAATYMRGIAYLQIPTTLLAMLDSSIGGKTSINTPQGKNLIGAYWQPAAVVSDLNCLTTLPKEQLINGLIEAMKISLTCDAKLFSLIHKNMNAILACDRPMLTKIIQRAVFLKAQIVQHDEKENNLRMILNFGHTMGHALEHVSKYKLLHGYAVGYGILFEAKIAVNLGLLTQEKFALIVNILSLVGIKPNYLKKYPINSLLKAAKIDKKTKSTQARYILLSGIGTVYNKNKQIAHPVADTIVKQAYKDLMEQ